MSPTATHLSALTLDALALGGLPPSEAEEASVHLESCDRCRKDAEVARADRDRFSREVFSRTLPRLCRSSPWSFLRRPILTWVMAPALAAVAVVFMVLPKHLHESSAPSVSDSVAIKGGPAMKVFARHNGRVFPVVNGALLAPGDEVRFAVAPAGLPYLLVASVDGAGKPSVYFPTNGAESGRLGSEPRVELPGSIILDAAPGPERIFALFSSAPLAVADVRGRLEKLGARGADAIRTEKMLPVSSQAQLSLLFEKSE